MLVDSHAHIFDLARFPYAPLPGYKPPPSEAGTVDQLLTVLDAHGMAYGIAVNPTTSYGTDNRCLLDGLHRANGRLRGIALVEPEVSDTELNALADGGVVGIRLNFVFHGLKLVREASHLSLLDRLHERGWIIEVYATADSLVEALPILRSKKVKVLIDHFGKPDPALGMHQAGFQELLESGREGSAWVKLSGPFRFSKEPWPHSDADQFVEPLVDAFTLDRMVWGSDWPFINRDARTDYGPTFECLKRWLRDPTDRNRVLNQVPKALFQIRS